MQRRVREKYITEKLRAWRCVDYRTGVYLLTELCFTLEYDKCARSGLRKLFASRTDSLYTVMYVGGRRIRLTFKIKRPSLNFVLKLFSPLYLNIFGMS